MNSMPFDPNDTGKIDLLISNTICHKMKTYGYNSPFHVQKPHYDGKWSIPHLKTHNEIC